MIVLLLMFVVVEFVGAMIAAKVFVFFILWIIYNGIDEGSKGSTIVQDLSYISLVFLLSLDIVILYRKQ